MGNSKSASSTGNLKSSTSPKHAPTTPTARLATAAANATATVTAAATAAEHAVVDTFHRTESVLEKSIMNKARENAESIVNPSGATNPDDDEDDKDESWRSNGTPQSTSHRSNGKRTRASWKLTERFWSTSSRSRMASSDSLVPAGAKTNGGNKAGSNKQQKGQFTNAHGAITEHQPNAQNDAMLGYWDYKKDCYVSDDHTHELARQVARAKWNQAMEGSDLMRHAPLELKNALFDQAIPVFINAGDVLFEMGGYGQMFFVLVAGKLKRDFDEHGSGKQDKTDHGRRGSASSMNRHHRKSGYLKPGVALAENCVLVNQPHEYSCTVKEDAILLAVHRLQYQHITLAIGETQSSKTSFGGSFSSGIREVPLLSLLSSVELQALNKVLTEVTFKPGQIVARATDPCPGLYIVKSGQVAMRVPSLKKRADRHNTLAFGGTINMDEVDWLKRGDFFGEATLFSDVGQLGINVFCSQTGPATLYLLRGEDFRHVVKDLQRIQMAHLSMLFNRLPLFAHLESDEIGRLVEATLFGADIKTFNAQSIIAKVGQPCQDGFYVVVRGSIKMLPQEQQQQQQQQQQQPEQLNAPNVVVAMTANTPPSPVAGGTGTGGAVQDTRRRLLAGHLVAGSKRSMAAMTVREKDSQVNSGANEPPPPPAKLGLSAVGGMSLHLLTDDNATLGADVSQSHDALFGMNDNFAVLFPGEVFADASLRKNDDVTDDASEVPQYRADMVAMGEVLCAFVPLARLDKMDLLDRVRQAYYEEEDGVVSSNTDDVLANVMAAGSNLHDMLRNMEEARDSKHISTGLLRAAKIKALEQSAHEASSKSLSKKQSAFTMNTKRLIKVETLHMTDLVEVYVAVHAPSKQLCIVKSLDVAVANQQGMGAYVLAEQLILGELTSPFINGMIAAWMEPAKFLMTLEPALGGDLENALHGSMRGVKHAVPKGELGGVDYEFVRFSAACVILALKHLYEHNIIHRDLKPANIILDHHGYSKLVDFGIAKRLPGGTMRTTTLLGSPKYMCPELTARARGSGDSYTNACDWWALGASMYQMLIGHTPFEVDYEGTGNEFPQIFSRVDRYAKELNDPLSGLPPSQRPGVILNTVNFNPFTSYHHPDKAQEYKWVLMQNFIARLLDPVPSMRLGAALKGGPREAMNDPLFKVGMTTSEDEKFALDWKMLAHRTLRAPFVPVELILDLTTLSNKTEAAIAGKSAVAGSTGSGAKAGKADKGNKSQHLEQTSRDDGTTTTATTKRGDLPHLDSQRRKAFAMQANDNAVESVVRNKLEALDGPIDHIVSSAQGARQRMVMAREQHLKRIAFRQGMSLDDIETSTKDVPAKRTLGLILIQRAALLESLHHSAAGEANKGAKLAKSVAAIRIQRTYRAYKANAAAMKELEKLAGS